MQGIDPIARGKHGLHVREGVRCTFFPPTPPGITDGLTLTAPVACGEPRPFATLRSFLGHGEGLGREGVDVLVEDAAREKRLEARREFRLEQETYAGIRIRSAWLR